MKDPAVVHVFEYVQELVGEEENAINVVSAFILVALGPKLLEVGPKAIHDQDVKRTVITLFEKPDIRYSRPTLQDIVRFILIGERMNAALQVSSEGNFDGHSFPGVGVEA